MEKTIDSLIIWLIWLALDLWLPVIFLLWASTHAGQPQYILLWIFGVLSTATLLWWCKEKHFLMKQIFVTFWEHLNDEY